MNSSQRWSLSAILLASLAALALHLLTAQHPDYDSKNNNFPDLYIVSPEWRLFDSQGAVSRRLSAERLEHWREQEPVLTEPRLRLTDQNTHTWLASARRGLVSEADHGLALEQQVELSREPRAAGPVVTTEFLRIAANGQHIETDQAVVIDSGSWHVSAKALRAELGAGRMELLGEVRGIHD